MSHKIKPINGYTKASMKAKIREFNNGSQALGAFGVCAYRTGDGNRCLVGCFLPEALAVELTVENAPKWSLHSTPTAKQVWDRIEPYSPLPRHEIDRFQCVHDTAVEGADIHAIADAWIEENVE